MTRQTMSSQFLQRPKCQKMTGRKGQEFLPADLAAAYASYHDNLTEQRKLEWKLHVIEIETKLMKRDYRMQKGILERELKKNENDFWKCHRVFSAVSLLTDSDSFKKDLYIGPKPTKAKLPRKTLKRLSHLVRSLQAEEEMEIHSRFERCARYARREELLGPVPSLILSDEVSSDSLQLRDLVEIRSEHSAKSRNNSGRINRIRSAPSRVESRKAVGEEFGRESPLSNISLKSSLTEKPVETFKSVTKLDDISSISQCEYRVEPSIRLAWVEKEQEQEMQKEVINSTSNEGVAVQPCVHFDDSGESSRGQPHTLESSIEQSADFNLPVHVTSSHHRITAESLGKDLPESNLEEFQPKEAEFEKENVWDAEFFLSDQTHQVTSPAEERRKVISFDAMSTKGEGESASAVGTSLIKIAQEYCRELPTPTSNDLSKNKLSLKPAPVKKHASKLGNESQSSNYKREQFQRGDVKIPDRAPSLRNKNVLKTKIFEYCAHDKAKSKSNANMTKALPKSSLQGLSSHPKTLTPRTQRKPTEKSPPATNETPKGRQVQNNSNRRSATGRKSPENVTEINKKIGEDETHLIKHAQKKKKCLIFKRKCLSELLYSGQIQVESQLRNRVQGFLSNKDGVDDSSGGTGKETFTHVDIDAV